MKNIDKRPEKGQQVIVIKDGVHDLIPYKKGEIWEVISNYTQKAVTCKKGSHVTVLMWTDGTTHRKECEPYVPKIINQYEIY
jgi:hypothetical protein